ncbi:hypothetical protein HanIR_Chr15g0769061 [Helianthus annuus]|nr:hypothetical protein HanIR_Chr15g0769061 [Helianthus annuus]
MISLIIAYVSPFIEVQLYQAAFSTFGGSMGVRPVRDDEEGWYDQIKGNFMFPAADAFASPPTATEGVLRDLGIDPEEKKKKPVKKKKKAEPEVTSKGTGPSRATAAADKAKGKVGAGGSKSSGSAGSRNPDAGATPSFPEDVEEEEDAGARLIGRKRGRREATTGVASAPQSVVIPAIGKTSRLRSLYQFSPGMFFSSLLF